MVKDNHELTEDQLAQKCVAVMREAEAFPKTLKVELVETAPGAATGKLVVDTFMLNGHHTCHGGVLFSFADTVFAYACNNRNQKAVSSGCSIDFLAPAFLGDALIAKADTTAQIGRNGIYDVTIYNQNNDLIAVFRGKSRTIPGQYFE